MKPLYACSKCGFVSTWRECGEDEKCPLTVEPAGEE